MSGVAHFFMSVGGSKFHERLAHFFIDIYTSSTPPPPKRGKFEALTIASHSIFVISFLTIFIGILSPCYICIKPSEDGFNFLYGKLFAKFIRQFSPKRSVTRQNMEFNQTIVWLPFCIVCITNSNLPLTDCKITSV